MYLVTIPAGVAKIGQTAADFTLTVNGVTLDGHKLDSAFQGKLEEVYPTEFAQATELEEVPAVASDAVIKAKETVDHLPKRAKESVGELGKRYMSMFVERSTIVSMAWL